MKVNIITFNDGSQALTTQGITVEMSGRTIEKEEIRRVGNDKLEEEMNTIAKHNAKIKKKRT